MSRLVELVRDHVIKNGSRVKAVLAMKSGLSVPLIEKVRAGHIPKSENAYQLALACGCSREDALEIAKECDSERARETA